MLIVRGKLGNKYNQNSGREKEVIRKGFPDKVGLHVSLQNRKKLGRKLELKKTEETKREREK